jgi:hypothetical protein
MYPAAQKRLAASKSRLLNSVSKASSTSALFFSSVVSDMILSSALMAAKELQSAHRMRPLALRRA